MSDNQKGDKSLYQKLSEVSDREKEFEAERQLLIDEALKSGNPAEIVKAMNVVKIKQNDAPAHDWRKSKFVDPLTYFDNFGYKEPPRDVTYETLRAMSRSPIINSIITTRKNQVASFAEPQKNRHSTGFIIRKKGFYLEDEKRLTKEDRQKVDMITEFIMQCGVDTSWSRDDFDTWLRKYVEDSLSFDQSCFEIVRNNGGGLHEWMQVDSATMRIADSYHDQEYKRGIRQEVGGYFPSYVQMFGDVAVAEFYDWEMCFGIRNPTSRIHSNDYGRSELEDMVTIVTSMLWSDQYNRNFFKLGAAPKGMLRIKGGSNNARLQEFRQQWKSMIAGVQNSWRTPILDAESMEWIDLQKSHRDMEFTKWQEYLIKLGCALYTIDPSEIGFPSGQSSEQRSMFESNNAQKLKYSKDKGLKPLLKHIQAKINKYIVSQIDPEYVFEFVGLEAETEEQYMSRIKDEVSHFKTINELRKEMNMKPIEGGDIIMNTVYTTAQQQAAMAEQQGEMGGAPEGMDEDMTSTQGFVPPQGGGEEPAEDQPAEGNPFADDDNPFAKSFVDMIDKLEKGEL